MTQAAEIKKPSALDALKALAAKKPAPTGASDAAVQIADPAIAGARRSKSKSTVLLGFDPSVAEDAATCAQLKRALADAEASFKVFQAKIRDYGKEKREAYNSAFKAGVTTVCVPYLSEVPHDPNSDTPGRETHHIQVICSNKYSVAQETVLANRETLGEHYDRLFVEEETKKLRANAEELIRDLLAENGIQGEALETVMSTLVEKTTKVSTTEAYEQEVRKVPESLRAVLDQAVTRVEPGLKFPDV